MAAAPPFPASDDQQPAECGELELREQLSRLKKDLLKLQNAVADGEQKGLGVQVRG